MIHNLCHPHQGQIHEGQEVKLQHFCLIYLQLRYRGGDGMQLFGYEESQSESSFWEFVCTLYKKMN